MVSVRVGGANYSRVDKPTYRYGDDDVYRPRRRVRDRVGVSDRVRVGDKVRFYLWVRR